MGAGLLRGALLGVALTLAAAAGLALGYALEGTEPRPAGEGIPEPEPEPDEDPGSAPDPGEAPDGGSGGWAAYLGQLQAQVEKVHYLETDPILPEEPLPGALGPKVVLRVPEGAPGAVPFAGPDGYLTLVRPEALPGRERVLIFGASAVYGDGVTFAQSLGARLEARLRRRLGRPGLRVLNLARPRWESTSVVALLRRVLPRIQPKPLAVILCSGNNELLSFALPGQKGGILAAPEAGQDPEFYRKPDWGPVSAAVARTRVLRPEPRRGRSDASFWPPARQRYLAQYRKNLKQAVAAVRGQGIPLLLLTPPINLHFFVAGVQPQPLTFRPVGAEAQAALIEAFEQALEQTDPTAALEKLVERAPDGPLQRYLWAQGLSQAGQTERALVQFRQARDQMMGVLGALPAMAEIMAGLKGPGVTVLDSAFIYPAGSTWKRSKELFNDSCHLSPLTHTLLARRLAPELAKMIGGQEL